MPPGQEKLQASTIDHLIAQCIGMENTYRMIKKLYGLEHIFSGIVIESAIGGDN